MKHARVIDRWVGVEYAVVPVPCNPEARMQAVAKALDAGLIDESFVELLQQNEIKSEMRSQIDPREIAEQVNRAIRETFMRLTGRV